jgi:chaperonin GroES
MSLVKSGDYVGGEVFSQKEGVDTMNFKPLGDRILVQRTESEEEIRGGIVIPDTAKEKPQEGKVVAVGEGKTLDNGDKVVPAVKVGDLVLFGKYDGTDVKINDEEYLILREDDILGILKS